MTSVNAMFRFVQLIRSLPSYGATWFAIRVKQLPSNRNQQSQSRKSRNQLQALRFGISREGVIFFIIFFVFYNIFCFHILFYFHICFILSYFVLFEFEFSLVLFPFFLAIFFVSSDNEIQLQYALTDVKRWAPASSSLTIDFGRNQITMMTSESEAIGQAIAGYIDIELKRRDNNCQTNTNTTSKSPTKANTSTASSLLSKPREPINAEHAYTHFLANIDSLLDLSKQTTLAGAEKSRSAVSLAKAIGSSYSALIAKLREENLVSPSSLSRHSVHTFTTSVVEIVNATKFAVRETNSSAPQWNVLVELLQKLPTLAIRKFFSHQFWFNSIY